MAHIEVNRPDGSKVTYIIPSNLNADRVSKAMAESKEQRRTVMWRLSNREKRFVLDMIEEELKFRTAWEMGEARREIEKAQEEARRVKVVGSGLVGLDGKPLTSEK